VTGDRPPHELTTSERRTELADLFATALLALHRRVAATPVGSMVPPVDRPEEPP
jgi:hypothetical protein